MQMSRSSERRQEACEPLVTSGIRVPFNMNATNRSHTDPAPPCRHGPHDLRRWADWKSKRASAGHPTFRSFDPPLCSCRDTTQPPQPAKVSKPNCPARSVPIAQMLLWARVGESWRIAKRIDVNGELRGGGDR
jgi:hypothetical protein